MENSISDNKDTPILGELTIEEFRKIYDEQFAEYQEYLVNGRLIIATPNMEVNCNLEEANKYLVASIKNRTKNLNENP